MYDKLQFAARNRDKLSQDSTVNKDGPRVLISHLGLGQIISTEKTMPVELSSAPVLIVP